MKKNQFAGEKNPTLNDGTEEIAVFIFKEDLGMFVKNTSLPQSLPRQWIT